MDRVDTNKIILSMKFIYIFKGMVTYRNISITFLSSNEFAIYLLVEPCITQYKTKLKI